MDRFVPVQPLTLAICLGCFVFAATRGSNEAVAADAPHIAGVVRSKSHEDWNVDAGRILLTELNCLSCHETDDAAALQNKPAPKLTHVGSRIHHDYLADYLLNPSKAKPGTTMPSVLNAVPEEDRETVAKAIAAFLGSTGEIAIAPPVSAGIEQGRQLFHQVGCVACHQPIEGDHSPLASSTPLPILDQKYSVPSLTQFLSDPLAVRSGGRMPHLGLSDDEARAIASYLLKDVDVPASVTYRYYEGTWDNLPQFNALEPKSEGQALGIDLSIRSRNDNFALVFDSFLTVPRDGNYTFYLGSDDGSRILLNEKTILEVDGVHPVTRKEAKLDLKKGIYSIQVQYFEKGGQEELYVDWSGPGINKTPLDAYLAPTIEGNVAEEKTAAPTDAEIATGRKWYQTLGCANCHEMVVEGTSLMSQITREPFKSEKGGCLSNEAPFPNYQLSNYQRETLSSTVADLVKGDSEKQRPSERIHETLVRFNCITCHSRGELGGVEAERNELFVGTQEDVGDEGRLPPWLAGVGAKLKTDYMKNLLNKGANDRFYVLTRMPGFGGNVEHLVADFEMVDTLEDVPMIETDEPDRRLKVAGRQLAGNQGLSCIKCHVFEDYRATGIQAISLSTMTDRLKKDWFQKYMLNPAALRPGTRMPESWPGGKSFFPKLLDGTADTQIHALWTYLEDADKNNRPAGLDSVGIELVAIDSPLIYRNFIEGAGSRAIGVGYPERVNLAFDANSIRLALLWQGAFIDASRHWTGRGQGYQPPLGDNLVRLPEGSSFARLKAVDEAWPSQSAKDLGLKFKGYRFNDQREPAFIYQWKGLLMTDRPVPVADPSFPGLTRKFTVEGTAGPDAWFRVAVAAGIEEVTPGEVYRTEDGLTFTITGDVTPMLRPGNQGVELLLQIASDTENPKWSIGYRW